MKTTVSVLGAGVGSYPGLSRAHPRLLEEASKRLREQEGGLLADSFVARCADGLELVMTHTRGVGDEEILDLGRDVLQSCVGIAAGMRLHTAGRGSIPVPVEMEFEERGSEPVLLFMAAGAREGAGNLHLFRTFADPFTTPGLVDNLSMRDGFVFEVHDLAGRRKALFRTPEESYALLACIGEPARYVVARVYSKDGAIAAAASSGWPGRGEHLGSTYQVTLVRAESGFPTVGECLAPFMTPFLVAGGLTTTTYAPLMPVAVCDANRTLGDGPPRATCLGFQVCTGRLIGPADMFDDPAFDPVRRRCLELGEMLFGHGPFEPHHSRAREAETTTRLVAGPRPQDRWEPLG